VQQIFKQGTYTYDWFWHVCYPNSDVDELGIGMQVPADGQNTGCCSYQPDKEVVTYKSALSNFNTYFFASHPLQQCIGARNISPTAMHLCKKCFPYSNALVQEMFPLQQCTGARNVSPTAMHWCKKCFPYSNALVPEMFPYSNALVQEMFLMQRQPHYKQETSPPNTSLMFQGFQHFFQFLYL